MAKLPLDIPDLVHQYGPTFHTVPSGGGTRNAQDETLVKTHCCFCGQQCGIQLRVSNNKVVGFEPWESFPFNKGKLCPKGVKRYMQDEHPDRLMTPLQRVEGRGFEPLG
jgi:assimilatory nitrate reductase catalytic subunit